MQIITDSYFEIGSTHEVCEDYCVHDTISSKRSYNNTPIYYGILSDGCSSQIDTDVGSRLLVKNFEFLLQDKLFQKNLIEHPSKALKIFIENTRQKAASFISTSVLDCTLLAFLITENKCHIFITGDGCVFLKHKTNKRHTQGTNQKTSLNTNTDTIEITIIDYENNAPVYLNYARAGVKEIYEKEYGVWKCICTEYTTNKNKTEYKQDSQIENDPYLGIPFYHKVVAFENYSSVTICSDGAQSFLKGSMLINLDDIARMILTLPENLTIDFMKNHMKVFKRQCKVEGWSHYDDFSLAIACAESNNYAE